MCLLSTKSVEPQNILHRAVRSASLRYNFIDILFCNLDLYCLRLKNIQIKKEMKQI